MFCVLQDKVRLNVRQLQGSHNVARGAHFTVCVDVVVPDPGPAGLSDLSKMKQVRAMQWRTKLECTSASKCYFLAKLRRATGHYTHTCVKLHALALHILD